MRYILAPQVGLEPTTLRLTAGCSAIELLRNINKTYNKGQMPNCQYVFEKFFENFLQVQFQVSVFDKTQAAEEVSDDQGHHRRQDKESA